MRSPAHHPLIDFVKYLILLSAFFSSHAHAAYEPEITSVTAVAPRVIAVTIQTGFVFRNGQKPYTYQDGDEVVTSNPPHRWLRRDLNPNPDIVNHKIVGSLAGRDDSQYFKFDEFQGEPLDTSITDNIANYKVEFLKEDDPAVEVQLRAVYRKSRPLYMANIGLDTYAFPMEHKLYIQLASKERVLRSDGFYRITWYGNTGSPVMSYNFEHRPFTQKSESVHVSQLGFRPNDPVKVAFLSLWRGNGGKQPYWENSAFRVMQGDRIVKLGRVTLSKAAAGDEDDYTPYTVDADKEALNYNKTDVYLMDFSDITERGKYRVCVQNVGCSENFEIRWDAWKRAFKHSMLGLYHQRSGLKLDKTDYKRPRNLRPGQDGFTVYHTDTALIETRNGPILQEKPDGEVEVDPLSNIDTNTTVDTAWGGYADAGDWDRRIQHLRATRLLIELAEMSPNYFKRLTLTLPDWERENALPDIIDEALWGLNLFTRMQDAEGGIRGGIESEDHPRYGEASWQESLTVMAYKPDLWSTYLYAATAIKVSYYLKSQNFERLSRYYRNSAYRAMEWAESRIDEYRKNHTENQGYHYFQIKDARNLAAVELMRYAQRYHKTTYVRWRTIFTRTTVFRDYWSGLRLSEYRSHDQSDAAFTYLRMTVRNTDLQAKVRNVFINHLADTVAQGKRTGFRWTKDHPGNFVIEGVMSVPQAINLVRGHYLGLDGADDYLETILYATQFGGGANPNNMVFTTGMGSKSPAQPLHRDHWVTNKIVPDGLTLNGPSIYSTGAKMGELDIPPIWFLPYFDDLMEPSYTEWPIAESYLDVLEIDPSTEFTIHQTIAPNAYVWGYLAVAKR